MNTHRLQAVIPKIYIRANTPYKILNHSVHPHLALKSSLHKIHTKKENNTFYILSFKYGQMTW